MAIINPSLHSNTKWTHFTQTKAAAIAANLLKQVHPSHNMVKKELRKICETRVLMVFFMFYLAKTKTTKQTLIIRNWEHLLLICLSNCFHSASLPNKGPELWFTYRKRLVLRLCLIIKTLIFFSEIKVYLRIYLF